MKKLKNGIFACVAALLMISAIVFVKLAIMAAISNTSWYWIYALIAVSAGIGARVLFRLTEYTS